jgi:hypothetical protein
MKKALVSPNEVVTAYDGTTGQRVAETAAAEFSKEIGEDFVGFLGYCFGFPSSASS